MKKKKTNGLLYIFIAAFVCIFISFPFLYNFLTENVSFIGNAIKTNDIWLNFYGSAFGGIITLFGVILTIKFNENQRTKSFKDNLMLTNEQLRMENLPYLMLSLNQYYLNDAQNVDIYIQISDNDEGGKYDEIYVLISMENKGIRLAKNLELQIIVNNLDKGKTKLLSDAIQVDETKNKGICLQFCKKKIFNENNQANIEFIFFYQDILGNYYRQSHIGNISIPYSEDNIVHSPVLIICDKEEQELTKITFQFNYSEYNQNKDELEEENERLQLINSFNKNKRYEDILLEFNKKYYHPKLYKFLEIINCKIDGMGGMIKNVKFETNNLIILSMYGGFNYKDNNLEYSYNLDIKLDRNEIKFYNFKIIGKTNLDFFKILLLKIMFRPKKMRI